MRTWKLALALIGLAASGAQSQWLEKTISLPDSFGALNDPGPMLYNAGSNTLFIAGDDGILVLDGLSQRKLGRTSLTNFNPGPACYASEVNKVYWYDGHYSVLSLDGANGRVLNLTPASLLSDMCYNPTANRTYIAYGSMNCVLAVINCANDSVLRRLTIGGNGYGRVCANSAENKVYCTSSGLETLAVIDCEHDSILKRAGIGLDPEGLIYSRTGNKVYVWDLTGRIAVLDCQSDSVVASIQLADEVHSAAFSPVSGKLYFRVLDSVVVVCTAGDTILNSVWLGRGTDYMVIDTTDNLVWCSPYETDSLIAIDGIGDTICRTVKLGHFPRGLCYNPARNLLYSTNRYVAVTDPVEARVKQRVVVDFTPGALCWARQQSKVYCAGSDEAAVAVINAQYNRVERLVSVGSSPVALGYDRALARVISVNYLGLTASFINCNADTVTSVVALPYWPTSLCLDTTRHKAWCGLSRYTMALAALDVRGESLTAVLPVSEPSFMTIDETRGRLYCGSRYDPRVFVIDAVNDTVIASIPVGSWSWALCLVQGGSFLCCATGDNDAVAVVDVATNRVVTLVPVGHNPVALAYSARRGKLYTANYGSNDVTVIDCGSLSPVATIAVDVGPRMLAYDSIADRVYVVGGGSNRVTVINCHKDSVVGRISVGESPVAMVGVPNYRRMYVASDNAATVSVIRDSVRSGVEMPGDPPAQTARQATIVRGVLRIENSRQNTGNRAELLDAAGRKVADLEPGPNDIRHLGAGVYFIQTTDSDLRPMLRRIIIVPH